MTALIFFRNISKYFGKVKEELEIKNDISKILMNYYIKYTTVQNKIINTVRRKKCIYMLFIYNYY